MNIDKIKGKNDAGKRRFTFIDSRVPQNPLRLNLTHVCILNMKWVMIRLIPKHLNFFINEMFTDETDAHIGVFNSIPTQLKFSNFVLLITIQPGKKN